VVRRRAGAVGPSWRAGAAARRCGPLAAAQPARGGEAATRWQRGPVAVTARWWRGLPAVAARAPGGACVGARDETAG
jgi:hypothetical protein